MKSDKNTGSLDCFRVFAAFLVAAIHTAPMASYSSEADFILTMVVARIAVPFFLMVTGYFILPGYLFENERTKEFTLPVRYLKKAALLYMAAIMIYLPVNLYAGQLKGVNLPGMVRMLIFDGTFYHLWYLPAAIFGVLLTVLMGRKMSFGTMVKIVLILYVFGLFGDSYFGFIRRSALLSSIYETMFGIFSYTRNGIFYAPVFLVMGAGMRKMQLQNSRKTIIAGFIISMVLMILEGMTLRYLGVQRHSSMYIALLPCMFFLFQILLTVKKEPVKSLRSISTWIYVFHPLCIIIVRGVAKFTDLENILVENSIVHYIAVCILSCAAAVAIQKISVGIHRKHFLTGRAWIELDMENLRRNIAVLKELLPRGCILMPAVKANAYGHGAVLISKELNRLGIRSFCVASVSEGIELRRNGIRGKILILGYTHPEYFPMLRKYRLIQSVIDYPYAELLNSYGRKIKVHIKIDTGMHRLGVRADKIWEIQEIFRLKNLKIEGAYTHLCSDETRTEQDKTFTVAQAKAFFDAADDLNRQGCSCKKLHLLSSYGLINYPELGGDYARIGIALYGLLSSRTGSDTDSDIGSDIGSDNGSPALAPILSVKARVALTKDLYAGEAAGYGLQYVAESSRKIAVLSIGYADGIPRALSCGHGKVLINGEYAPIAGRICMDQMAVDVTDIPDVKSGDIAVIIGKSGQHEITAYDLAEECGTITNELLSRLGSRLNRLAV